MNGRPRSPFTDQQLTALHKKGLNDAEIARELGVRDSAIFSRRKNLGLKAHGRRLLFTDQQLIAFNEKGFNDYEIAEKLGVDRSTVIRRRRKLGLKAHGRRRPFTDEQLIELHEQSLNDVEIGKKLGVDRCTVRDRRWRLGLKSTRTRKRARPGALLGERVYDLSIKILGDPHSPQAHFTIPWVLRIPQVFVPVSVLFWSIIGLVIQMIHLERVSFMR